MCYLCNDKMTCFQAVRTKLSHTSYKQPHKPVSYGVRKAYNFFVKNQNGENLYLNQLYARKVSSFLFLAVFSCHSFLWIFQSFYVYFTRQRWFVMVFLWNFALGIGAQPAKIDTLAHARCLTAVHARSLLLCFAALFPIILDKLVRSKLKKRRLLDYGMAWRWVSTQFFVLIKMRENNGMRSSLFMVASRNSLEKTLQRHRNVGRSALHYESEKIEIIITLKLKYNTKS